MIDELVKLANHLDSNGLINEADYLDRMIKEARMLSREHSSWPAEMWPHQKDLFNGNGMLRAIAKAERSGNDNISKKCADRDAIGKLTTGLNNNATLGSITFRHFKDDKFCYAIAEVSI